MLNIVFIIVGVALVLWGADRLTDGAEALAQRMNIPQIVIGLTVVAMGTSMPEFFVSLVSAIKGTPDLAVGNVVGSNIMNTLLIVGVTALVAPLAIARTTVKKDIPFAIGASVLLTLLCLDNNISRLDAALLTAGFIFFIIYTVRMAVKGKADNQEEAPKKQSVLKSVCFVALGLACLIVGSNLFVEGAVNVATLLGVSQAVIGLTVVAGGTSLPELATSVMAARKGRSAMAIGNVIGSNVFNILMILGITGLVCPMQMQGITIIDFVVLLLSILVLWLFSFTKFTVERWEGAWLLFLFVVYMLWLIKEATGAWRIAVFGFDIVV
ncbi:MAG: calcium/sodium antiporter [Prevotella sp.]|nr:calcium/sodium antiporter [Prevotella sp.]